MLTGTETREPGTGRTFRLPTPGSRFPTPVAREIPDERQLKCRERESCVRHVGLPLQRRLRVRITCAGVPQAAVHAHQSDREHRHEDQVHAHERTPEVNLAEGLVQRPAGDRRIPEVNAGKEREHGAGRDQVVKMRDHVIGIVQRHVAGGEPERQPGQAADPEHRQEREREEHRRVEGDRSAPQRQHQRRDQNHRRDRDDKGRHLEEPGERRPHARQEHVMGPDHHRHAAHEQHRRHHQAVAPERPPRVGRDHFSDNAHCREDQDVDLGMPQEPEEVLPQQWITAAGNALQRHAADHEPARQEETGAGDAIHQLENRRGL